MHRVIHWIGVLSLCVVTFLFVFFPHLLGISENPDVKNMRYTVMVDFDGNPIGKGVKLASEYNCKFWIAQIEAIDFKKSSAEYFKESILKEMEHKSQFLATFEFEKRRIEDELLEIRRLDVDKGKPIRLMELNKLGELRNLIKQKETFDQSIYQSPNQVLDIDERINGLNRLKITIANNHGKCL